LIRQYLILFLHFLSRPLGQSISFLYDREIIEPTCRGEYQLARIMQIILASEQCRKAVSRLYPPEGTCIFIIHNYNHLINMVIIRVLVQISS
jgi:hypothetical protein